MPKPDVTYDRPVKATLIIRLNNAAGEEWEATPEDLAKFGYINSRDTYALFRKHYANALHAAGLSGDGAPDGYRDVSYAETRPLRYLIETALIMPELLDHPEHDGWAAIADIEQRLREHMQTHSAAAAEAATARCCPHNDDSHDGSGCLDCPCNKAPGTVGYNPTPGPDTAAATTSA